MPDPQIPQKPGSITPPVPPPTPIKEPVIRTMPERYIGAAAGRPPVVREIVETRVVQPPPSPAPQTKAPVKKTKRTIIIASIVVLLAGAGAVAYILFTPVGQAPPPPPVNTNIPTNTNNQPPITNNPPSPVCGNAILETGEECDDGNTVAGDGCSDICMIEPKAPPPPNTGIDSDSDGLTDSEETSIYGTDPHKLDTDGDSFNDGNEVAHLYDPNVKAPALLEKSKSMTVLGNALAGYSVLAPAKWTVAGKDKDQLFVTAPSGEFFEVLVTQKPKDQSLVEWYLSMSPGAKANEVERFKTLGGYDALRSPDRLTAYIDPGTGDLFTLTYSYDEQTTLEFRTTYEAFVASFTLLKP